MTKVDKEYVEGDFVSLGGTPPSNEVMKKRRNDAGLSITNDGRLSFTTGLQKEMGIDPADREGHTYVQVLAHKSKDGVDRYTFFIKFTEQHGGQYGPAHKLIKPDRRKSGVRNNTSYLDFGRYLKQKGLIPSVGEAKLHIKSGPVDLFKKDIPNRSIIINLESRFIKN